MRFPNWFRILWWVLLMLLLGAFIGMRLDDLAAGRAVPADVVVFLVLVILALTPLYDDIGIFGFRVRSHLRKIEGNIDELRTEIRNSIDLRNSVTSTVNVHPTLPADQLAPLTEHVRRQAEKDGIRADTVPPPASADDLQVQMFKIRREVESELLRIYESRFTPAETDDRMTPRKIALLLADAGLVDRDTGIAIAELYALTSRSIHGRPLLPEQVKFVFAVHGWGLAELRSIR